MQRRTLLRSILGAGSVGFAGCFGGQLDGTPMHTDPETTHSTTVTSTATRTRTTTETSTRTVFGPPPIVNVFLTDELAFQQRNETLHFPFQGRVRWTNTSSIAHTVTAYEDGIPEEATYFASGGFASEQAARDGFPDGTIPPGESFEHEFETNGTYEYFCIPHEDQGMTGTIEVMGDKDAEY